MVGKLFVNLPTRKPNTVRHKCPKCGLVDVVYDNVEKQYYCYNCDKYTRSI